ncbi:hypothetical protein NDU88_004882 [Pleurodeles waltl]|uniref:Uncharacterized protein n=1 Tax=Pleurodeles waltl TaxID=8319 RepID=A0AAV7W8S8_PLEWA|nr:hypothetical protein NDU88_004882 [Pleurodeles waltl]
MVKQSGAPTASSEEGAAVRLEETRHGRRVTQCWAAGLLGRRVPRIEGAVSKQRDACEEVQGRGSDRILGRGRGRASSVDASRSAARQA